MRLLLVRHGITHYNQEGFYTGQTDIPLSPLGEEQAEAVGRYLAQDRIDIIFSSDLQRARDTAIAIARYHHLPVLEDPDLREAAFGDWEGLNRIQAQEQDSAGWDYWRSDPVNHAPPGGENLDQVRARAARMVQRCLESYADQTVLWATHGGLMGVALCFALQLDLRYRRCFRHDNASVTELAFGQELPVIMRLNDTAHLRSLALVQKTEGKI